MSVFRRPAQTLRSPAVWLLAALVIVVGCGTIIDTVDDLFAPVGGWVKPGVSAEARRRDEQECEKVAVDKHGGRGGRARGAYEACMEDRGYTLGAK